jgi:hypothetical protein
MPGREQARVIPGMLDSYVSLHAYAAGHFSADGRVQSGRLDLARVRLRWDNGYAVEDRIENGIAMLFGARPALEPATIEFLDAAGHVMGAHVTFVDEP